MSTINVVYACSPASSGGASTDLTVAITAPTSVMAGGSAAITFSSTQALPASLIPSTDLAQATGVEFSAEAPVSYAGTSPTVKLSSSATISSTSTQIPATTATTTSLPLATAGTATIKQPDTVQVIATGATGTTFTAITCTASTSAAAQSMTITVKSATTTPPPLPGPLYNCTISATGTKTVSGEFIVLMNLRADGKLTTGSTDTITFTSKPFLQGGLGGPWPGASNLVFQGSLPVTGAQQGSISIDRPTRDVKLTTLKVTNTLFLSQPGTISIHFPQSLKLSVFFAIPHHSPASFNIACTSHGTPQVGVTLKVTGKPVQPPAPQGSATPVPTGTGTPVGAPNTGGGRPASNLPLVAGGAALLAVGAGLAVAARRRRHSES